MDDPRERRRPGRTSSPVSGGVFMSGDPTAGDRDWPARPWVGLVERYAPAAAASRALRPTRVAVVWWPTSRGPQPVLFMLRERHH